MINQSSLALLRDIFNVVDFFSYGELVGVSKGDSFTNFLDDMRRTNLLKYFEGFTHEKYGQCWTLDLRNLGMVEPLSLRIKIKVNPK